MQKLAPEKVDAIIRYYLMGFNREEIADKAGVGGGSVSHYLGELKKQLDFPNYEEIHNFFRQVLKVGVETPRQFATTVRMFNAIRRLGVEEDDVEPLVVSLYSSYDKLKSTETEAAAILPDQVAKYAIELFEIANKENIPISEVSKKLKKEIEDAKTELEKLKDAKKKVQKEKKEAEALLDNQLRTNNLTIKKIEEIASLNAALAEYRLSPKEAAEFMRKIQNVEKRGHSITTIAKKIDNMATLEQQKQSLKRDCEGMQRWLVNQAPMRKTCEELIEAGFDTLYVRRIKKVVGEIQKARSFNRKAAIKRFLFDIENYDKKLGFEKEIETKTNTLKVLENRTRLYNDLEMNQKQLMRTLVTVYQKGIAPEYMSRVCDIIAHDYGGNALLFEEDLERGRRVREESTRMQERAGSGEISLRESLSGREARSRTMTGPTAEPTVQHARQREEVTSVAASDPGRPPVDREIALRATETRIQEGSASPAGRLIAEEGFQRQLFLIPNAKFPEVREALDPEREKIGLEFDDNRILAAVIKEIN